MSDIHRRIYPPNFKIIEILGDPPIERVVIHTPEGLMVGETLTWQQDRDTNPDRGIYRLQLERIFGSFEVVSAFERRYKAAFRVRQRIRFQEMWNIYPNARDFVVQDVVMTAVGCSVTVGPLAIVDGISFFGTVLTGDHI